MRDTRYNTRSSEWIGDMAAWLQENADDNQERLARLRKNLRQARERELTPNQRQVLDMHYDQGLSVTQIAAILQVNPSTVSRTLHRAINRLRRYLQYAL